MDAGPAITGLREKGRGIITHTLLCGIALGTHAEKERHVAL